jgi:uncharacterized protein with GYD domain
MAMFVTLVKWTDQGIKGYKDSVARADAFTALVEKSGGRVLGNYWMLGEYDLVTITEAPDAETATAVLLQVGALGNVRTTTMHAFDRAAFQEIVEKAG